MEQRGIVFSEFRKCELSVFLGFDLLRFSVGLEAIEQGRFKEDHDRPEDPLPYSCCRSAETDPEDRHNQREADKQGTHDTQNRRPHNIDDWELVFLFLKRILG